ncbi:hypothetical protein AAVH_06930 [Aphelenchoides avenae]|nr:hypothetical protein AAVH_06930 [Aphelenchus avenae]
MLRGEYEQNRSVLENISKMVADLYKEKHDNAELRIELEGYKQRCEKLHETIGDLHDKLIEKDDAASKNQEDYERVLLKMDTLKFNQDEKEAVICELQEAFYKLSAENESANITLAKAQEELDALRLREKEKDRKLTVLAEEMEKKCCELESKSAENADIKHAMEEMQKELMALKKETVNQAEIIRILQEENTEATRAFTEARKEYREKLDAIEQQWLRHQVARNEVNFPDAVWFVSGCLVPTNVPEKSHIV